MLAELSLAGLWKFRGFKGCDGEEQGAYLTESKAEDWLLAEAPLTAHTNLMANKLIPDPFVGLNEREVQWVNESEWWYRKEINLETEIINKDIIELSFESLDTFATIWVNDVKVGEANNMFTPWRFDMKPVAKVGKNLIAIRFKPVHQVAGELERTHKHKYTCLSADNFSARPYVRKAQYSFGWDWGPTLPTAGIWRQAKVIAYDTARLGYLAGLPVEVSNNQAKVKLSAEIHASKKTVVNVKFALVGFGQTIEQQTEVKTNLGRNFADCTLEIKEPHLWWPRGYGEPSLYDCFVKIFLGNDLLDESNVKIGIRNVQLLQQPDDEGKTFIFQINGVKVYCKGANWIPADSFLPKVNYERYHKLLNLSAQANFNMLRVWGGGVYEADEFYSLCDSLGIMVWQDFMYACAGYPEEEWFLREAEREAMEAVLRLRGHPSIILWCGNNENQWLHCALWRVRDKVERLYGSQIYESLLKRVCQFLDPTRPYRPSSPYGGEDLSGLHEGDRHNWEVWSQGIDYPAYLKDNGRFISEFGWQSLPSMELLSAYLEKQDLTPNSFAFRAHEKQTGGLELLRALLAAHYPVPEDMRNFVLYSQLNQADALKTAINHWRSRMFKTSGWLIWQLNDCWPVVSWSLIDYGLTPKAAYYAVKRASHPVISPIIVKDDVVHGFTINETAKDIELKWKFAVINFNGENKYFRGGKITVSAFSSKLVFKKPLGNLSITKDSILTFLIENNGVIVDQDTKIVDEPKNFQFPIPKIQSKIVITGNKSFEITLQSDVYAKAVFLQFNGLNAQFSDNFFDLIPKQSKTVSITLPKVVNEVELKNIFSIESYPYKPLQIVK